MTWRICLVGTLAAVLVIPGTYFWLHGKQQARAEAWANAAVADKVQAAEVFLAREQWDRAIPLLQDALDTEPATDLEKPGRLLSQARCYQADALLDDAELALRRRDAARALDRLDAYLAHPKAGDRARALALQNALEFAVSDARAVDFLQRLSDEGLATLVVNGELPPSARMADDRVQVIYQETLSRHVENEKHRRAQDQRRQENERRAALEAVQRQQEEAARRAREETQRRETRVLATPVFRELTDFVALTRKTHTHPDATAHDKTLRRYLFRVLRINDAKEQRALLDDPTGTRDEKTPFEEKVSTKRANFKERFRSYKGFEATDWEAFDQAVDKALDQLLVEVRGRE